MEWVVVLILIYLMYLAGSYIKHRVQNDNVLGEVLEAMDDLEE